MGIGRVLDGHWTGAVIRKLNFRIRPTRFLQIPDNIVSESGKSLSGRITKYGISDNTYKM